MLKFRKNLTAVLLLVLIALIAHIQLVAAATFDKREIQQGTAFDIRIPNDNIAKIEATFDGKPVYFYPLEIDPRFDEAITRGEFLKLIFENHDFGDIDLRAAKNFPDVSSTSQYYEYVQKASALDIIHGYADGNFHPEETLTRGQTTKILFRAFEPNVTVDSIVTVPEFKDVPLTHMFYSYIRRSIQIGIFQGYPDGLMRPDRAMNVSEAEIVLKRMLTLKNENTVSFNPLGKRYYWRAFIGIHRLSDLVTKPVKIKLTTNDGTVEEKSIDIQITKRNFPTISFSLTKDKVDLFGKDQQDVTWQMINEAKANPSPEKMWEGLFMMPTSGELTLGFGDKLYINGAYSGSHFGHDYANKEGTEVYASNSGKVILSAYTPSYGNTIVIDHGQNIYTMYLHLSALKVEKDQMVKKSDLIGLMGATGIATGPHLHFTAFIGEIIVDPTAWINQVEPI